jgi:Tfp pilus assembly protein FimT
MIELMVVIVLIGIMTAMILPEMKGTYEDALLRAEARKLADVFSLANSRAITVNQLHRVRIDRRNGQFSIETAAREAGKGQGPSRVPEITGGQGTIDTRISFEIRKVDPADAGNARSQAGAGVGAAAAPADTGNGATICFYPDGTADEHEIELQDRHGFRLALHIDPVTARVRVVERGRP